MWSLSHFATHALQIWARSQHTVISSRSKVCKVALSLHIIVITYYCHMLPLCAITTWCQHVLSSHAVITCCCHRRQLSLKTVVVRGICQHDVINRLKAGVWAKWTQKPTGSMLGLGVPCTFCLYSCYCWPWQSGPSLACRTGGCLYGAMPMQAHW